jgi:carboxylate-amine ligase
MLDAVGPALEVNGDTDLVRDGVARIVSGGGGARRQRTAAGPDLDLTAVVDDVMRRT